MQNEFLTPAEVAVALGVSSKTLAVWRCTRRYPLPYVKIGAKVMYQVFDVNQFIESRRVQPQGAA